MTRVVTGRRMGIPYAHILNGSVVVRTFVGFTRQHAAARARRHMADRGIISTRRKS